LFVSAALKKKRKFFGRATRSGLGLHIG